MHLILNKNKETKNDNTNQMVLLKRMELQNQLRKFGWQLCIEHNFVDETINIPHPASGQFSFYHSMQNIYTA